MNEIPLQQEFQPYSVVRRALSTRISSMAGKRAAPDTGRTKGRRGAYKRAAQEKKGPVTNFIKLWRLRQLDQSGVPWTQERLSEESGVSVASISAYESGAIDPSMQYLQKLADALGVTRGMLLDVNPDDDPPLWAGFLRASEIQRREIGRIVGALVGAPKSRR